MINLHRLFALLRSFVVARLHPPQTELACQGPARLGLCDAQLVLLSCLRPPKGFASYTRWASSQKLCAMHGKGVTSSDQVRTQAGAFNHRGFLIRPCHIGLPPGSTISSSALSGH